MLANSLLFLSALVPVIQAQETVLGAYIFHRHGDRTSKSFAPTSLTDLGYYQVHAAGTYYNDRYINANASSKIHGIAPSIAKLSQLSVEAPYDAVLQPSALGFLQGLYPPVGSALGSQQLANGTTVDAPLDGYQLIPVQLVVSASTSATSENSAWLQGASGCPNAITSSNNYFYSSEYQSKLASTNAFYQSLSPVINATISAANNTFKNAYSIYDLVHVSQIHNTSIPSGDLLTDETVFQLQTLADNHEYNLAYNVSEPIRAIAGSTLAAQILLQLNTTVTGKSKLALGIQFGAYASFMSFFALAQLPQVSDDFTGIVDYASSMTFEIVTNATVTNTSYPSVDDISVRFLFANGTASASGLTAYPLFGQEETVIPWTTFVTEMNKISIGTQSDWCSACGLTTGVCAATTATSASSPSASSGSSTADKSGSGGMSKAVAGVVGAFVTLAVILGIEALVLLVGGFRIAKKNRTVAGASSMEGVKA